MLGVDGFASPGWFLLLLPLAALVVAYVWAQRRRHRTAMKFTNLELLRRPPRRRGLAVVISDFLGATDWQRALRGLGARHSLLAIEVVDPRDVELPDVGTVVLSDPETGKQREVHTTPVLRREFAAAAAAHREDVAIALRRAGCAHLTLRTDSDWIAEVVRFVMARKRGWSGGAA